MAHPRLLKLLKKCNCHMKHTAAHLSPPFSVALKRTLATDKLPVSSLCKGLQSPQAAAEGQGETGALQGLGLCLQRLLEGAGFPLRCGPSALHRGECPEQEHIPGDLLHGAPLAHGFQRGSCLPGGWIGEHCFQHSTRGPSSHGLRIMGRVDLLRCSHTPPVMW